jgi:hypothetical protein
MLKFVHLKFNYYEKDLRFTWGYIFFYARFSAKKFCGENAKREKSYYGADANS